MLIFLDNDIVDSVKKIPELAIFLIENAPDLFDHFEEDGPLLVPPQQTNHIQLHQSTDSGLSDGAIDEVPTTNSPDSLLFDSSSPTNSSSADNNDYKSTPLIQEIKVS